MNKKISVGITASLILIAITITFTATMLYSMKVFDSKVNTSTQRSEAAYNKILEIDKVVRQEYYEDVDEEMLYGSLIKGYVAGLGDPDSVYVTAEEIAIWEQQAKGTIVSAGIDVTKDKSGYLLVNNVYADSSAAGANIQKLDIITKINDIDVFTLTLEEGQKLLTGVEGTTVKIEYTRAGEESVTSEITLSTIEATSIESRQIENVYYVRVRALWDNAGTQFGKALRDAVTACESNNAVGLVIDLRDLNTGHNLSVVADMLDLMLPTGATLSGIYRGGEVKVLYTSDATAIDIPVTVLVNGNTKGYAEAFAAALKDSDICLGIVGTKTAGKGTLQKLVKLQDGSGVDISVALLKPPKSDTFHKEGVKPNSEVNVSDDFKLVEEPTTESDAQFAKAVDILRSHS